MVVNDGLHGNLEEFSHVRWIDNCISIAPRTVCRDKLHEIPLSEDHWTMVSCKMFQRNQSIDHENWSNHVKPQLLPVPSQLHRHFPSIDRSQPPWGCGSRSSASTKFLRHGTSMISHGFSRIHVRLLQGMLWTPKKDAEVTVDLPLHARLRTYLNVFFFAKFLWIVREWLPWWIWIRPSLWIMDHVSVVSYSTVHPVLK